MSKSDVHFRLDDRCISILESVRDENLLPSLTAAVNFLIMDYRRIKQAAEYPTSFPNLYKAKSST